MGIWEQRRVMLQAGPSILYEGYQPITPRRPRLALLAPSGPAAAP